jgi:hypothetical protein
MFLCSPFYEIDNYAAFPSLIALEYFRAMKAILILTSS